jgi:hypothetical protein
MNTTPEIPEPKGRSKAVPVERILHAHLRNPRVAAHYLAEAFANNDEVQGFVAQSLEDVIRANPDNWVVPYIGLHFSVPHLSPDEIERLINLMAEVLIPEYYQHLVQYGVFQYYRGLIDGMRLHGRPPDAMSLKIGFSDEEVPAVGLNQAKSALEHVGCDPQESEIFQQMGRVLCPA